MRARRMRRRLFNLFAFALLAFAIYLVKFSKTEDMNPNHTALKNSPKSSTVATTH
ncbi:hypothetical protein [Niastella vici]|uniref:hypothetical protein n=1 Tax=Niastella vici TaxID=1703345 RepID=UPI001301D4C4|nr:hypothetical protein [Niastella vici]